MGARIIKNNQEYKQTDADFELYSDFDNMFLPNPFTKQLGRKTNESSVSQSLRNLLLTNKYERRRNPDFGSTLSKFLFEPFSPVILGQIKTRVEKTIKNNEPRVRILDLEVTTDSQEQTLIIDLRFATVSAPKPERLRVTLNRVR
jgi:phage baseplate assembly protein W